MLFVICFVFPFCWIGEKVKGERNELRNFLLGITMFIGGMLTFVASIISFWVFL